MARSTDDLLPSAHSFALVNFAVQRRRPVPLAFIRQRFCLPEAQTDVRADLHYVSVR